MSSSKNRELISLVFNAGRLVRRRAGKEGVPTAHPLSFLQLEIMRFVKDEKLPTMKDIASRFSVTPPSATSAVDSLVSIGYVKRISGSIDRRRVRLALTARGSRMLDQCMKERIAGLSEVLGLLSAADKANLAKILRKIIAAYQP